MAIDYETESIITLGEACRAFPPNGVSDATMARWIQRGVKVCKLRRETVALGGSWRAVESCCAQMFSC
ncbi:MAG: hypothetical protein DWI22_02310 [Planctomycetota bacterium]|nr:MAG: hypothetical protein DWI22_02310 [Planctomycetota bacterium]